MKPTKARVRRACMACGRVVAVKRITQNTGGGKGRVPHKCSHGVPCITGGPDGGHGMTGTPTAGPYYCRLCFMRRLDRDRESQRKHAAKATYTCAGYGPAPERSGA